MERAKENDGAVGFDYPNNVAPERYNQIKYGTTSVPTPTNSAAKMVNAEAIMRATNEAK